MRFQFIKQRDNVQRSIKCDVGIQFNKEGDNTQSIDIKCDVGFQFNKEGDNT